MNAIGQPEREMLNRAIAALDPSHPRMINSF